MVLVYLPVRAAADPFSGWGDPSSLAGFWDHLTGARIRGAYAQDMGATGKTWVLAQWAVSQLWDQLGVALPMAAIGLVVLATSVPASALPPEPVSVGPSPQIGPDRPPSWAATSELVARVSVSDSNRCMGAS
jgi:hypothetical protein